MEDRLVRLGLSTKEARVYLALLELGSAPASDLAKKAGIKRSTAYVLLEALAQRGLVTITDHVGVRYYNPASPDRLVHYAEDAADHQRQLIDVAKELVPELRSIYAGIGAKPKVQFLEGSEGIESAYEDTLTSSETIRAYASIENMHKALPHYFPTYYRRRAANGIFIRAIFPDTPAARERVRFNKEEMREAYLVPREQFDLSPEINIYDNKVALMSLVEKFALIIESRELAEALKKSFELSWQAARLYHEKKIPTRQA